MSTKDHDQIDGNGNTGSDSQQEPTAAGTQSTLEQNELDPIAIQEARELETLSRGPALVRMDATRERHKRFAKIWFYGDAVAGIEPFHQTKAYKAVYGQELDDHSACSSAGMLLKHPDVVGELHALRAKLSERGVLDHEAIRREIAYLAQSNLIEVLPDDPDVSIIDRKHLKSLPEHVQRAIGELDEIHMKDGSVKYKIKMHSKTSALDLATKVERMVGDKKLVNNGVIVNIKGDD
jgi:hypothetical protein